jgi:chemotaxis protein MotB
MREILAGREGVEIVGDRFVFQSEVLFDVGSAELSDQGRAQIANVGATLLEAAREIPPGIDWILRVDGHTDDAPIRPGRAFASNWELSQARALSVVLYLVEELDFPPERLVAAGFGEYRPVIEGSSPEARAANRRIELKLTER